MESSSPVTSFIPKKSVVEEERPRSEGSVGLVTAFVVIAFLVTIVAGGGMFLWEKALSVQLDSSKANLQTQKEKFQPEVIGQFKRIDDRLAVSNELIVKHNTPLKFLQLLQSLIYKDVSFAGITYVRDDKSGIKASMTGEARDYQTIILQSDFLNTNKYIKEYVFSNLTPKENGRIGFSLSLVVDGGYVLNNSIETVIVQ